MEGLSKAPAGNEVLLDLALDRDGILHVTAREKRTGLERRIGIDQAVGTSLSLNHGETVLVQTS